jgi:hypothetical protein
MNEFTPEAFIDRFRDEMWTLWDAPHASGGCCIVYANDATEIVWEPTDLPPPKIGNLLLAFDFGDYLMLYEVARFGGASLIKKYMINAKNRSS